MLREDGPFSKNQIKLQLHAMDPKTEAVLLNAIDISGSFFYSVNSVELILYWLKPHFIRMVLEVLPEPKHQIGVYIFNGMVKWNSGMEEQSTKANIPVPSYLCVRAMAKITKIWL